MTLIQTPAFSEHSSYIQTIQVASLLLLVLLDIDMDNRLTPDEKGQLKEMAMDKLKGRNETVYATGRWNN